MLEVGLGKTNIPGPSQPGQAQGLRQAPFNSGPLPVKGLPRRGRLALANQGCSTLHEPALEYGIEAADGESVPGIADVLGAVGAEDV